MKNLVLLLLLSFSLIASTKPLDKVSLQLAGLEQFQFAGYYMAKEKGFYKDAGLDVEIKKFKYSMDTVYEVLNGRATFGVGHSSLIRCRSEGKKIVLLCAIFQSSPFMLLSLKSSNIKSVKDFKGKKLMLIKNAVEMAPIHAMLNSNGIDESDLKFKEHNFNLEELIDGRVDLYAAYTPNEPYILKQRGIAYKIFSPKEEGFDFYGDLLFTSQKEVQENPLRVERFKEASLKGWEYAFSHIDETVKLIYEKYNLQNKTVDALSNEANELKKLAYSKEVQLGNISQKKIQRIYDVYKTMGLTDNKLDINGLVLDNYSSLLSVEEQNYLRDKKEIKICVLPNSLPYSAIEKGEYVGIGAEILSLTTRDIDISYKLVETKTWMESLKRGENSECDLLPIASKIPSREHFFNFTTPFHYEPLVIVTDKEKDYILDFNSVIQNTFSIVEGHSFIEELKVNYPNIKLKTVSSTKDGLIGVQEGRFYGHIDVLMSCAFWLKHFSSDKLQISGQFDERVAVGFAIRKDDQILFEIFEKISKDFKPSELQKLLNDWVFINYTNGKDFENIKKNFIVISIFISLFTFIFLYRQYLLKRKNRELQELQDKLIELNKSLEDRVKEAVDEIVKKDSYLLHQSRLAQMGEMLSMIAHQWKQPLSSISIMQIAIKMSIELKKYDLSDKIQREEFLKFIEVKLDKIGANVQNLSQIISDFSDFYKPNKKSEIVYFDSAIIKACHLIEDALDANNIKLHLDLHSKMPVKLHENEFMQVILNIVSNAKEQLINKNIENAFVSLKSYDEDCCNGCSVLEISDNAGGIEEDMISKIFDPYFSTKLDKNGTGLGLYMSKNIIENYHNGSINVKNNKDGALFIIRIRSEDIDEK